MSSVRQVLVISWKILNSFTRRNELWKAGGNVWNIALYFQCSFRLISAFNGEETKPFGFRCRKGPEQAERMFSFVIWLRFEIIVSSHKISENVLFLGSFWRHWNFENSISIFVQNINLFLVIWISGSIYFWINRLFLDYSQFFFELAYRRSTFSNIFFHFQNPTPNEQEGGKSSPFSLIPLKHGNSFGENFKSFSSMRKNIFQKFHGEKRQMKMHSIPFPFL